MLLISHYIMLQALSDLHVNMSVATTLAMHTSVATVQIICMTLCSVAIATCNGCYIQFLVLFIQ